MGQGAALTSLMSSACSMTSVRPLSCREESSEGSWNTNTVTTSVAVGQRGTAASQWGSRGGGGPQSPPLTHGGPQTPRLHSAPQLWGGMMR